MARLRLVVGWTGAIALGLIALLASAYLLRDLWAVVSRLSSLAAVGVLLSAIAVILAGALSILLLTWLAGRSPRATRLAIVAGLVTLVLVRVIVSFTYDGVLSGEPGIYERQAAALAGDGAFAWDKAFERPPGYAFLLAAGYAIGGQSSTTIELLNILLALASGLIVLDLARHLYGSRVGATALMLYALWPAGALMVAVALPHTSYDLAIAAGAWAVVTRPSGWRGSALAGLLLGLSQYLRPTTLIMLPAFLLARAWGGGTAGRLLRDVVTPMLLAFLLVLLPVAGWHLAERGTPDLATSAYGGTSLFHGTNAQSGGTWSQAGADALREAGGRDVWSRSQAGQQLAMERLREDPVGIAVLAVRKQVRLWGRETYGVRYGIRRELATRPWLPRSVLPSLASSTFYASLLALTALGLWLRRRETDALSALLVVVALTLALMHGFVEVRDRYHAYLIPLLMPIAAVALVALVNRWTGASSSRPDPDPSARQNGPEGPLPSEAEPV